MTKATLTSESVAAVSKRMGCSIEEMHAAHAFKLEGKPLFEIFRGSDRDRPDSTSGKPYTPDQVKAWPALGLQPTDPSLSNPFKSKSLAKAKTKLTDDQKKIARAMGVSEEDLAARLDTLTDDEEDVVGVDGERHPTRRKAPHSVQLVRDLVA